MRENAEMLQERVTLTDAQVSKTIGKKHFKHRFLRGDHIKGRLGG